MKSTFPDTPTMRYERMLLAAMASVICFFLGLQFGSMAMQFAAAMPASLASSLRGAWLRLVLLALSSAGFCLLGVAFFLFALIKMATLCPPRYFHLFVRARAAGILFVWVAFVLAGLWVAANIALHILN